MSFDPELDRAVRLAAFKWLDLQKAVHGEVLPRSILEAGFQFAGNRVPILGPQGIFKPKVLSEIPLSITTTPGGPYDDELRDGSSVIHYRYRGTDVGHHENVGLKNAHQTQTPLVFCYRVTPGSYVVSYPVFVCGNSPANLTFDIQLDDEVALNRYAESKSGIDLLETAIHRRYITINAKRRLHQVAFRERVLKAYQTRCTLCRLRHGALLDAAHIIPDGEPDGLPEVSNGLSLCKIHHAAYDLNYLGITPNFKVEVRKKLLDEIDGPMLQHGIKALHGESLTLPRSKADRPSTSRLEARFERFLNAEK